MAMCANSWHSAVEALCYWLQSRLILKIKLYWKFNFCTSLFRNIVPFIYGQFSLIFSSHVIKAVVDQLLFVGMLLLWMDNSQAERFSHDLKRHYFTASSNGVFKVNYTARCVTYSTPAWLPSWCEASGR